MAGQGRQVMLDCLKLGNGSTELLALTRILHRPGKHHLERPSNLRCSQKRASLKQFIRLETVYSSDGLRIAKDYDVSRFAGEIASRQTYQFSSFEQREHTSVINCDDIGCMTRPWYAL